MTPIPPAGGEIDTVIELSDLRELIAWAGVDGHSPESRLLAGAKAEAILAEAIESLRSQSRRPN